MFLTPVSFGSPVVRLVWCALAGCVCWSLDEARPGVAAVTAWSDGGEFVRAPVDEHGNVLRRYESDLDF